MKFKDQMKGRRQSSNVEDQRGRNAQVRTTAKSPRLHPMGSGFVSGMNKIEAVNRYAKVKGAAVKIKNSLERAGW